MIALTIRARGRSEISERLVILRASQDPDSPAIRTAMMRAALLLQGQIKLEIRKQRLIDQGWLLNSIKWEFYNPPDGGLGIRVGSYGIPYAAVYEYGMQNYKENVRPHTRTITSAFGEPISATTVNVSGFTRIRNVRARPYLRPAMAIQKQRIASMLAEAAMGGA